MIEAVGLGVRIGRRDLLRDVLVTLHAGEVMAVIGPNGAGKSTLLRVLSGELRPSAGTVTVAGRPVTDWHPLALARRRAVVSQTVGLAFPMTVAEVAALGRLPWHDSPEAARDVTAIAAALDRADVAQLAARSYTSLSGGERQRVQVARALAQLDGAARPRALLLDEPTASLDAAHRAGLLRALRGLAAEGAAVLVVLHDMNEATFVADRVAVLCKGQLVALGSPAEALRPEALAAVYGMPFRAVPGGGLLPEFGMRPSYPISRSPIIGGEQA